MAKTVAITASYIGTDVTSVDVYNTWPGGTRLSGSFSSSDMLSGIQLTGINDSIFTFVLVDTATSASSTSRSLPGPTITDFNPKLATTGTTIQITGSGLFGATSVNIGTINAGFTTVTNTNMQATVPLNSTGSNLIIVTTPAGIASRPGWQYDGGTGPVVYNLGGFTYDEFNSGIACLEDIIEVTLYSTDGISIDEVYNVLGKVYTDQALTQTAQPGWYSGPTLFAAYYVDVLGNVVERRLCTSETDGGLNPI